MNIIGNSEPIKEIKKIIKKVAVWDSSVLISGESGTGKELVAQAIHSESPRRKKPLITINCGAIPAPLFESELFGHEMGAFTSAHQRRIGRFERANGGTLFFDEIGEMPPDAQVKLLRVLQEKTFERMGGNQTIHVDIRVLAATNRNLARLIREGRFRDDLFYRLNVVPIQMPPLRDRKVDIPLLVEHFTRLLQPNDPRKRFSPQAVQLLLEWPFPGNVRELKNIIESAIVLSDAQVILPENIVFPEISRSASPRLEAAEAPKGGRKPDGPESRENSVGESGCIHTEKLRRELETAFSKRKMKAVSNRWILDFLSRQPLMKPFSLGEMANGIKSVATNPNGDKKQTAYQILKRLRDNGIIHSNGRKTNQAGYFLNPQFINNQPISEDRQYP